MGKIYKTSAIHSFEINKNVYINQYVFVSHQRCIVERTFLPNYLSVIEGGWYKHNDISENYGVPINIKKCKPVVAEDCFVFTPNDSDYFSFDESNFKKWLWEKNDKEWYHCEFDTMKFDDCEKIEKITLYTKGQIVISIGGLFNVIGLKHIDEDTVVDELTSKLANAIEAYPYFKLEGCDLIFLTQDLKKEFKL